MITEIVGVITEFAEAFWSVIVGGMTELSTAFFDDGSLTFVGTILFIGLGLFLVMFVVNWLRRLIKS
jgi:hypothetical protein